jgi:hypothetical protein
LLPEDWKGTAQEGIPTERILIRQAPIKLNPKHQMANVLDIGILNLEIIWDLKFEIWNFR